MKIIFVCCIAGLCMACTPRAIREARDVVAQADSLWHAGQMYGEDAGDSATLAQAYETLGKFSVFSIQLSEIFPFGHRTSSPGTYAHACYHYGRLLRAKEDPVSAMQVFIAATHSHTRDYHILGRVYSNMGSICHLAGEFPLSYDMYEKSANMFLLNGDTIHYYYALNDMALELAEQGKKEETYGILNQIERFNNTAVLTLSIAIKAILCNKVQQYDSTIHYTSQLLVYGHNEPDVLLTRAQAYSYLHHHDSATYYAKLVLSNSNKLFHRCNALYILTNEDEGKDITSVRETAMDRADTQRLVEIRQGKLAQATQLLKQDLDREPDLQWLYAIIFTSLTIGICISIYIYRKRNQYKLLSQQVDDLTNANNAAIQLHEQIIHEHTEYTNTLFTQIEQNSTMLYHAEDFPNNIYWKDYSAMSKLINDNFGMLVTKLQNKYQLSEKEIRLCILVLLGNPSGRQLASLLYYGESGIRTFKNRIANKLGTNSVELRTLLINLAISEYSKCSQ